MTVRSGFRFPTISSLLFAAALLPGCATGDSVTRFPVEPELFIDTFEAAEGISFSAEGRLFIAANRAAWMVERDGTTKKLADAFSNLGMAGIGERDVLMADFGPTVALREGSENDGIVWRITPDGEKTEFARGIADPNFVLVMEDGNVLVSDDFTNNIYEVDAEGNVAVWSNAIPYPNGLALSPDGSTLYVAQIFTSLKPIGFADRVWAMPIENGRPAGTPRIVAETGGVGGIDGLAVDERGGVYIAENQAGKIWRLDPTSGELTLVAEGVTNVASLVFGEGEFDHHALYVACTFRGGGKIWKVDVGVSGSKLFR